MSRRSVSRDKKPATEAPLGVGKAHILNAILRELGHRSGK